jgi:hypothetical protein
VSNIRYNVQAASASPYNKSTEHFQEAFGGLLIKLCNLDIVPQLLMNAISDAGQ